MPPSLCEGGFILPLGEPIEAHFGPLRQLTLTNSHDPHHGAQTRELYRYCAGATRTPDVLGAQRRKPARVRVEKGIRWGGQSRSSFS